jgi:hypothetical protein
VRIKKGSLKLPFCLLLPKLSGWRAALRLLPVARLPRPVRPGPSRSVEVAVR